MVTSVDSVQQPDIKPWLQLIKERDIPEITTRICSVVSDFFNLFKYTIADRIVGALPQGLSLYLAPRVLIIRNLKSLFEKAESDEVRKVYLNVMNIQRVSHDIFLRPFKQEQLISNARLMIDLIPQLSKDNTRIREAIHNLSKFPEYLSEYDLEIVTKSIPFSANSNRKDPCFPLKTFCQVLNLLKTYRLEKTLQLLALDCANGLDELRQCVQLFQAIDDKKGFSQQLNNFSDASTKKQIVLFLANRCELGDSLPELLSKVIPSIDPNQVTFSSIRLIQSLAPSQASSQEVICKIIRDVSSLSEEQQKNVLTAINHDIFELLKQAVLEQTQEWIHSVLNCLGGIRAECAREMSPRCNRLQYVLQGWNKPDTHQQVLVVLPLVSQSFKNQGSFRYGIDYLTNVFPTLESGEKTKAVNHVAQFLTACDRFDSIKKILFISDAGFNAVKKCPSGALLAIRDILNTIPSSTSFKEIERTIEQESTKVMEYFNRHAQTFEPEVICKAIPILSIAEQDLQNERLILKVVQDVKPEDLQAFTQAMKDTQVSDAIKMALIHFISKYLDSVRPIVSWIPDMAQYDQNGLETIPFWLNELCQSTNKSQRKQLIEFFQSGLKELNTESFLQLMPFFERLGQDPAGLQKKMHVIEFLIKKMPVFQKKVIDVFGMLSNHQLAFTLTNIKPVNLASILNALVSVGDSTQLDGIMAKILETAHNNQTSSPKKKGRVVQTTTSSKLDVSGVVAIINGSSHNSPIKKSGK